jgi:hypothetical protein
LQTILKSPCWVWQAPDQEGVEWAEDCLPVLLQRPRCCHLLVKFHLSQARHNFNRMLQITTPSSLNRKMTFPNICLLVELVLTLGPSNSGGKHLQPLHSYVVWQKTVSQSFYNGGLAYSKLQCFFLWASGTWRSCGKEPWCLVV